MTDLSVFFDFPTTRLDFVSNVIDPQPDHRAPELAETNGYPYVGIRDINPDGSINVETARKVKLEAVKKQELAFRLFPGDIVFCKVGTLGLPRRIKPVPQMALSATLVLIKPQNTVDSQFLFYALDSDPVKSQCDLESTGSTRQALGIQQIRRFDIPFTSLDRQRSIARFLDRKTAAIDTLIAKKQRLIQLLEKKRTALINQAVTKGLNPSAPMKDSGITWIGEIPEHWGIVLLKRVANVRYGLGQPPPEIKNGLPLIRATNVKSGSISEQNMIYVDTNEVQKRRNATLVAGEIIVVRSGAYTGDSAIIPPKYEGAIAGYDMVATIKKGFSSFIAWQLLSKQVRYFQFAINQLRAAQSHLNAEELNETILCFPPVEEQKKINLYLRAKTDQIDTLISRTQSSIEKLQEYRRSLITAAVTGKLDVAQEETL